MAVAGMSFVGAGHPPLHRFRLGVEFLLSGRREVEGMIEQHAAIARTMAEQLLLPEGVLEAIGAAYERWDGRGWPGRVSGETIPIAARIAQVAEYAEVAARNGGTRAASGLAAIGVAAISIRRSPTSSRVKPTRSSMTSRTQFVRDCSVRAGWCNEAHGRA